MRGYVANTDYEWYRFLHAQGNLAEVNFWQPSGNRAFRAIEPGSPFFFKLKKPHYAVAGFGFFARHSILPAWLAWETFKEANGAADFAAMRARIERLRDSPTEAPQGEYRIGCLMIAEPIFFDEGDWIRAPADFHRNIQQGATYDLTQGEGKRLWDECLSRGRVGVVPQMGEDAPRYGAPAIVRPRLGQGIFRIGVMDAYDRACAITSEHSLPVLEAAHIRPYSEEGEHRVSNGLLLRSDIHRLFDKGYVTVTPDYRFLVSQRLKKDFDNGRTYFPFSGRAISLPRAAADRPDPNLLEWHGKEVFLG